MKLPRIFTSSRAQTLMGLLTIAWTGVGEHLYPGWMALAASVALGLGYMVTTAIEDKATKR